MRTLVLAAVLGCAAAAPAAGQARGGPPPASPRAAAPIDLTGYWVAYVTEDWRYRMVTPPKGDYRGVPMTEEARRIADAWDAAADTRGDAACKAYGAPAIMRVPGRLHVTWQDDRTLRVDTDAGQQTRLFRFGPPRAATGARTWQGQSAARWESGGRGRAAGPGGGSLAVVTSRLRAGYPAAPGTCSG